MNEDTPERFKLKPEDLASIKLEIETVSPEERRCLDESAMRMHARFIDRMNKYFAGGRYSDEFVAEKFIYSNDQLMKRFSSIWADEGITYAEDFYMRAFGKEGNFVVGVPVDLWSELSDDLKKGFMHPDDEDENRAKNFVNGALMMNMQLHEITHLYQVESNQSNYLLIECQAFWVAREIAPEEFAFHTEDMDKRADFYQKLLDKYGDDVHRVCFGSIDNQDLLTQIESEFSDEVVEDLFPEYDNEKIV